MFWLEPFELAMLFVVVAIVRQGAGFYVNATQEPWSKHYRMYDYVNEELPALVAQELPVRSDRQSLMGHSMGGHGALISGLREGRQKWACVSAFAPISHPVACPWGQKAFAGYLGADEAQWKAWDATELVLGLSAEDLVRKVPPLLIDVGTADNFLHQKQLLPEGTFSVCVCGRGRDWEVCLWCAQPIPSTAIFF